MRASLAGDHHSACANRIGAADDGAEVSRVRQMVEQNNERTALVVLGVLPVVAGDHRDLSDWLELEEGDQDPAHPVSELVRSAGSGRGQRVGTAYRLESGEIIYVPEEEIMSRSENEQ